MKVTKHTNIPKVVKVWYSMDKGVETEKKYLFDTLHHWGIIEQVNAFEYWHEFEQNRFDEKIVARCELKVDNAFRRAIDIKENILRSLDLDHSINEDILQNVYKFVSTQLKDLTDDHYKIQNIFKDIKANIILSQME
tara:strand:- start:17 stop:427 length:411 start_codon:yes stop_codon:yes gene_type:complete